MLYVLRHGQTDWNVEKKTQGSHETTLNSTGISQAKKVGRELQGVTLDAILCSPRKRCKETAEIINKGKNVPIIVMNDLKERNFGEFEGKIKGKEYDVVEFWNWEINKKYEQAENVRDFCKKIDTLMDEIILKYCNKNILIITHGGVCAAIYCYFNNIKPDGKLIIPGTENCKLIKYDMKNRSLVEF